MNQNEVYYGFQVIQILMSCFLCLNLVNFKKDCVHYVYDCSACTFSVEVQCE